MKTETKGKTKKAKKSPAASARATANTGLAKQYLKTSPSCKVTFRLPKEAASDANNVTVVGDFNGWSNHSTPMKRLKDGCFAVTITLQKGKDYRFRYLIDGKKWENDWCADRYAPNPYGGEDSIVSV